MEHATNTPFSIAHCHAERLNSHNHLNHNNNHNHNHVNNNCVYHGDSETIAKQLVQQLLRLRQANSASSNQHQPRLPPVSPPPPLDYPPLPPSSTRKRTLANVFEHGPPPKRQKHDQDICIQDMLDDAYGAFRKKLLSGLNSKLKEASTRIEDLQKQLEAKEAEMEEYRAREDKHEKAMQDCKNDIAELDEALNAKKFEFQNFRAKTKKQIAELKASEKAKFRTQTEEHNRAMQESEDEIAVLSKALNAKKFKFQNYRAKTKKQIAALEKENAELMAYDVRNVDSLDEAKLDGLRSKFKQNIELIDEAKNKLVQNQLYCVACMENKKSIILLPCQHAELCHACEAATENKICPRCSVPFTSTVKFQI